MSDNNGWPGEPGVPLNPERDGWHWVDDGANGTEPRFWSATFAKWDGYPLWMAEEWDYLRPCSPDDLTPAEVEARVKEAVDLGIDIATRDLDPQIAMLIPWQTAIEDALSYWCDSVADDETPKDALRHLIQIEMDAALDPEVSQAAADLVAKAKRDALEECISICNAVARANRVEYPEKWKDRPEGIPHEWQRSWETCAETAEDIAAAIHALSDTPPDMVLVPREPTPAMIKACLQAALDFMAETKTTEVHPGQTYPSPGENARRCWRAMVKAAGKGEGDE